MVGDENGQSGMRSELASWNPAGDSGGLRYARVSIQREGCGPASNSRYDGELILDTCCYVCVVCASKAPFMLVEGFPRSRIGGTETKFAESLKSVSTDPGLGLIEQRIIFLKNDVLSINLFLAQLV
mgnify:CR=1 FL=1